MSSRICILSKIICLVDNYACCIYIVYYVYKMVIIFNKKSLRLYSNEFSRCVHCYYSFSYCFSALQRFFEVKMISVVCLKLKYIL